MFIKSFLDTFQENGNKTAIISNNDECDFNWLRNEINKSILDFKERNFGIGAVVALKSDFSLKTIALLFALIERGCIIVPIGLKSKNEDQIIDIANVQHLITLDENAHPVYKTFPTSKTNKYYEVLLEREHPGIVLFSSGSSGTPKAAVHDFVPLLEKFKPSGKAIRALNFLLFDHWGGLNTMFHILSSGGTIVTTADRNPEAICRLIEKHKIELLPTTPTLINLILLSGAYNKYDLQSLKVISYGAEPMPRETLSKLNEIFPNLKLKQTYGLIEVGVLHARSEKNDSLWVKLDGKGFQTRVRDNILQIKTPSSMLGYINAKSPFTEDGWFITGDRVEVKGDYYKILGRESELINIGGEKIYPQEIENVILGIEGVKDVIVYAQQNNLVGNLICAIVQTNKKEGPNKPQFRSLIKQKCKDSLDRLFMPVKVDFTGDSLASARQKKQRSVEVLKNYERL